MAKIESGQKVLVLGCGNGEMAIRLAHEFPCSIIATDINPLSITTASHRWERIKDKASGQIEFRVDDLFHSQLALHYFDRIIIESVLIMIPKLPALKILHDLLTPVGRLALNEGVCLSAVFPELKKMESIFQQHQIDWYLPTENEWASFFEQAQFQIVEIFGPHPYSLKRIGLASFFHNPWQSLKVAWKIMSNSGARHFFKQISAQLKAAAIKWGYGLWVCESKK